MKKKRIVAVLLFATLLLGTMQMTDVQAKAAGKVTKVTITNAKGTIVLKKGTKKKLKVKVKVKGKKVSKKVTYKSSNKKVVKVNSKGICKVKKSSGKATITVTSKVNPKKKAKVTIMAGNPVKSLSMNQKAVKVYAKRKVQLKTTVMPVNATMKKVVYKSSNKAIATVNANGQVSTLKGGKAVITAVSADGSNKKASVTFTVVDPTVVSSAAVVNKGSVQFTLSSPQALKKENIHVWVKDVNAPKFQREATISIMINNKNKVYSFSLSDQQELYKDKQVKLQVNGLKGTGTVTKVLASKVPREYIKIELTQSAKVGEPVARSFSSYSDLNLAYPITEYSFSNLPAGMKVNVTKDGRNLIFSGKPTKVGAYQTVAYLTSDNSTYKNCRKFIFYWNIYSDNQIVASYKPDEDIYGNESNDNGERKFYNWIYTTGGSGSYSYQIVKSNGKFTMDADNCNLICNKPGNYWAQVKITDTKKHVTYITVKVEAKKTYHVRGKLLTADGKAINQYMELVGVTDKTAYAFYGQGGSSLLPTGEFNINAVNGSYMIEVEYKDQTYIYPCNVNVNNKDVSNILFKLPVS